MQTQFLSTNKMLMMHLMLQLVSDVVLVLQLVKTDLLCYSLVQKFHNTHCFHKVKLKLPDVYKTWWHKWMLRVLEIVPIPELVKSNVQKKFHWKASHACTANIYMRKLFLKTN